MDTKCDVNDAGDFTFATNTDGATNDDYIVTNVGGVWGASAREGDPVASLPGNTYDDLIDTPLLLADGTSGFAADGIDGTVTATEDDVLILGTTVLLQPIIFMRCRRQCPPSASWQGMTAELKRRRGSGPGEHWVRPPAKRAITEGDRLTPPGRLWRALAATSHEYGGFKRG